MAKKERLLQEETLAGEGIARVLEQAGIDMIFGIQGGNMLSVGMSSAVRPTIAQKRLS